MIPIAGRFLIVNEGIISNIRSWAKNSVSNVLGKRSLNRVKSSDASEEKIETSEKIQSRLTPKPSTDDKLGFKPVRTFKQPANLI